MTLKICVLIACCLTFYNMITALEKKGGTLKGIASGFVLLTLAAMASEFF